MRRGHEGEKGSGRREGRKGGGEGEGERLSTVGRVSIYVTSRGNHWWSRLDQKQDSGHAKPALRDKDIARVHILI